jgi:purine-binding chemotaxis protein CheW
MEYIVFKLMEENFAVKLDKIKEILVYSQIIITELFGEKDWISGVVNLRGEVIPIVDLRLRFNQKNPPFDSDTVAIVIKSGEDKLIGIIVDKIESIMEINSEQISQTGDIGLGIDQKFIDGLVKINKTDMTVLFDIDAVLKIEELV